MSGGYLGLPALLCLPGCRGEDDNASFIHKVGNAKKKTRKMKVHG